MRRTWSNGKKRPGRSIPRHSLQRVREHLSVAGSDVRVGHEVSVVGHDQHVLLVKLWYIAAAVALDLFLPQCDPLANGATASMTQARTSEAPERCDLPCLAAAARSETIAV